MKKQSASWNLFQMAGLVMFTVLFVQLSPAMAQDGLKPGQHSVERPPKGGGTTTVEREGPCVIDLTAPKTTGSCHLGVTDPPAKLKVANWYGAEDMHRLKKLASGKSKAKRDRAAKGVLKMAAKTKDPIKFWSAVPIQSPKPIDPAPGETITWHPLKTPNTRYIFSKTELAAGMKAAIEWANAWKAYRGSRFGKGK